MYKSTAAAYSNLAFVKYWGKIDHEINLPANGSISMNLSGAKTTTTVEFSRDFAADEVFTGSDAQAASPAFTARVSKHLDKMRQMANLYLPARVATANSFPMSAGFASSASGMAALTVAGVTALGLDLSERELSILARSASGSACRSIPAGFAEWKAGNSHETSYAAQLAPPEHWAIMDVAVVVSHAEKRISSSLGHRLVEQSLFWDARLESVPKRLDTVRAAILNRDFETFGRELETEAISMHAIAMTSSNTELKGWHSGIYYWLPDTLELIMAVQNWRSDGLPVYLTLDAGPTVHLICPAEHRDSVVQAVKSLEQNRADRQWSIIVSEPAGGAHTI